MFILFISLACLTVVDCRWQSALVHERPSKTREIFARVLLACSPNLGIAHRPPFTFQRACGSAARRSSAPALSAKPYASRDEWITLFRLAAPDWIRMTTAIAALVVAAVANSFLPKLQGAALNTALGINTVSKGLGTALGELAFVSLVATVFAAFRGRMISLCAKRLVARLRKTIYIALLRQPQAFHDEQGTGALTSRLSADCIGLGNVLSNNLSIVLRNLVELIVSLSIVLRINMHLACLVLGVSVLRMSFTLAFSKIFRRLSKKEQDALAASSDVANQGLSLIKLVSAYGSEHFESARYSQQLNHMLDLSKAQANLYGASILVGSALNKLMFAGVLGLGGVYVATGVLPRDGLSSFVLYSEAIAGCLTSLAYQWGSVQNSFGAATRVFDFLKPRSLNGSSTSSIVITPLAESTSKPKGFVERDLPSSRSPPDVGARIDFEGVNFRYPNRPEAHAIKNLSLSIQAGERVAIVGKSGSGKSSLFALVLHQYQPLDGKISLDGEALDAIDKSILRSKIAWVQQEPPLFPNMTIHENIAYGLPDIPRGEVEAAAREVNAYEFIRKLDHGFDTYIGATGASLSGGQKQRISLARAILRDPSLLLLDEPTSALDTESERAIEKAILTSKKERTILYTTHKLAQARHADRILVMSSGELVEEGTHEDLIRRNGAYSLLLNGGDSELE